MPPPTLAFVTPSQISDDLKGFAKDGIGRACKEVVALAAGRVNFDNNSEVGFHVGTLNIITNFGRR
jgi:hypothetical protein